MRLLSDTNTMQLLSGCAVLLAVSTVFLGSFLLHHCFAVRYCLLDSIESCAHGSKGPSAAGACP